MDSRLDLNRVIRPELARMEDSLIFDLFERAKYPLNKVIYEPGRISVCRDECLNVSDYFEIYTPRDLPISFLDFILKGTEELQARAGRFRGVGEYPFTTDLPKSLVARKSREVPIRNTGINFNEEIKSIYLDKIRSFCKEGDDENYGSTAICDVRCLQNLSKRIHFGAYVAEAKFQSEPGIYIELIHAKDQEGILNHLTNIPVEKEVIERVRKKGERYGVDAQFIADFYRDSIIPLTKVVEVEYLIRRGSD